MTRNNMKVDVEIDGLSVKFSSLGDKDGFLRLAIEGDKVNLYFYDALIDEGDVEVYLSRKEVHALAEFFDVASEVLG